MTRDAIIVGIDRYAGAPLTGCVADARDFAACLTLPQYDFDCRLLLDAEATRADVLGLLGRVAYSNEEREMLLFYFAGHGQALGDHGHLVTFDGTLYDPGISLAHLGQLMESASTHYEHVIAILDCCHAGAAMAWVSTRPLQARDIDREVQTVNESRCILAACRPEQPALESREHGYFTQALLDGMLGNSVNFNGDVTLLALHEYVAAAIPESVQTPVFKGDVAGTVVLGSGLEPRRGRPLEEEELSKTLSKARRLVDEYEYIQQRELANREHRAKEGGATCAQILEPSLEWFDGTEAALAELHRNSDWLDLRRRMRDYQGTLADLSVGYVTKWGTVVRHLGRGGYGHVWDLETADGGHVALKVFHGNELDDEIKVQRFRNGYSNMRKLAHPRIVKVRELTVAPYAFLMDSIPGENLRAYIDREDPGQILRLLIEVAETVQHAHNRGVKHRDIKPENIIVVLADDGTPVPYLTDFDLAYHETNRTVTTNLGVGGVINYGSPEQLYMPNAAAARARTVDIYALAQLMFFLVVGRDPAGDAIAANAERLRKKLNDWVEGRAAETLLDLYGLSTQRDPAMRPQSVNDFGRYLSRAESFVLAASGQDKVEESDFCRRLGHLHAGVGGHRSTEDATEMKSLSGQVAIVVRNQGLAPGPSRRLDLEIEFSVTEGIPVANLTSGSSGRTAINARLDKSLRRFPEATRHPGTKGAFQTVVKVRGVGLDIGGLGRVQEIIATVVSGIEQW